MDKKKEITSELIDIFDRMNMDTPSNFDEILDYVYEDVCETADEKDWSNGDVVIAFRRWIENAQSDAYYQGYEEAEKNK